MPEIIIKTENAVIRQKKNTILKNVNLEIQRGEFIYIIGKVGSGKSSFLKTLYAELPLEYGKAEVAGFQLKKIKKSQVPALRRKCGIVFQDFKLLTDRTVYDNLEFVLRATGWKNKKAIQERIDSVLEKVEMPDKKDKMPHELSGGEQQRIVLARALLNAPPLILADEPTGNIDPETSYRLIELLKDICASGTTVIIATHQYDLLEKYPGKVLRCDNGTLTEDTELSVPPHSLAPEAIESIENIPLEAGEPEESELPSVLEADILTPVSVNPETEQPDTFLAEEQNVQPINETVVSAKIKAEEKTVPVQKVIQEPTEQQNTSHTEENVQPVNETVVSAEIKTEEKTVSVQEVIQEPTEQQNTSHTEENVQPVNETIVSAEIKTEEKTVPVQEVIQEPTEQQNISHTEENVQPVNETVVSAEIKAEEKTVPVQEVIQEPTEQQNTSHTEEQNVQPINETVVSAEIKAEEKTVPVQEVIQEPTEQQNTSHIEENVQPVNETVVSAETKTEEKTVPIQEVIQEPTEQQNTSHTEENVQSVNETVVSAEIKTEEKTVPIQEVIQEPTEQPVNVSEIHPEGTVIPKAVPTNEGEIEKVKETKDDDTDSADEKTKPEIPFGFELIE